MDHTAHRTDAERMRAEHAYAEHLAYLRAAGAAETTIAAAGELLRRADREMPYGLCTALPEEIITWLGRSSWSAATRASYRGHIIRFFRWAVAGPSPCLDLDPSAGLPAPRVRRRPPRPASDEQVRAAVTRTAQPWRLHCILAAYGGLRCCEIAVLDRADVSADELVVHGKGDKIRVLPTDPYVWAIVHDLPPGPVTRRPDGRPADAAWVSNGTRAHLRRVLGITTTPHRLRAWFATRALDACGDIRVVQELLGHESVATTQVYTQVNPVRRAAAVAGLPRLAGG